MCVIEGVGLEEEGGMGLEEEGGGGVRGGGGDGVAKENCLICSYWSRQPR